MVESQQPFPIFSNRTTIAFNRSRRLSRDTGGNSLNLISDMIVHFFPYKSKHHLKTKIEAFSKFNQGKKNLFILYGADKRKPIFYNELSGIKLIYCSRKLDI